MTKASLRQLWFQLHKWIGIILAIVLIPLSLTGSLLVWDEALDRALNPKRYEVTGPATMPISNYVATAMRALPADAHVVSLAVPEEGEPVLVSAAPAIKGAARPGPPQRVGVWLDPKTGKVLDVGSTANPIVRFMHRFHGSLLVPGVGRSLVGWLGVLMTISCLSGLWLWWPMVGRLARAFRWRRQPQFDTNLHHMVGFWVALPLALLSITGVLISFPGLTGGQRPGAGAQGPSGQASAREGQSGDRQRTQGERGERRSRSRDGQTARGEQAGRGAAPQGGGRGFASPPLVKTSLSLDQAVAASGVTRTPYTVTWPTVADASWRIATTGAESRTVMIDDASGAVVPPQAGAVRQRSLTRKLHDGTDMGIVFQTIIFLGGIAPAALGITGITMWLRTRRWRGEVTRRTKARRQTAAAAAE